MFPVLGVLGPRQVGKSTFLIKQWSKLKSAHYVTFDQQETILRAKHAPEQFLLVESNQQSTPLIIDEAQKLPHIFDSIKALVDQKRRLGSFILTGSVDFSSKLGIKESLAGRLGITRLYPMTMRELAKEPFTPTWVTGTFSKNLLNK